MFAVSGRAEAQQPKKVPTIGFLASSRFAFRQPYVDAFRQGLSDLGYIEERNIAIEWRYAEGNVERAPDLASDLVRLKVAVLVVGNVRTLRCYVHFQGDNGSVEPPARHTAVRTAL